MGPGHDERPPEGELRLAGRMGAIGGGVGALSGVVMWIVAPELAGPPLAAALGIVVSAAIAIACLLLPWDRLSQRWVLFPIVGGIVLTALASANSLGTESPYA